MSADRLERSALARFGLLTAHGEAEQAQTVLRQALALEPDLPRVHQALARLRWPGPDCLDWLAWLHRALRPDLYVEIGVGGGEWLALAQPPTRVVGVDPAPVGDPLARCAAQARLYRQPSAQFLRLPPADSGLRSDGFDLACIDGEPRFEDALDDFIGLEAWAAPGALIVVRDTLPLTPLTAARERRTGFYTGERWKIVPCLRGVRPELRVVTLPVAPAGLTLVAGLDPQSPLLRERREDIVEACAGLDAARAVARPEVVLGPLAINDAGWVSRWLRDAGVRSRS
jgi:predicted O-methyltransferase YrrM